MTHRTTFLDRAFRRGKNDKESKDPKVSSAAETSSYQGREPTMDLGLLDVLALQAILPAVGTDPVIH